MDEAQHKARHMFYSRTKGKSVSICKEIKGNHDLKQTAKEFKLNVTTQITKYLKKKFSTTQNQGRERLTTMHFINLFFLC